MISKNISLHWADMLLLIVKQNATKGLYRRERTLYYIYCRSDSSYSVVSIGWLCCGGSDVSKVTPTQEDEQCRPSLSEYNYLVINIPYQAGMCEHVFGFMSSDWVLEWREIPGILEQRHCSRPLIRHGKMLSSVTIKASWLNRGQVCSASISQQQQTLGGGVWESVCGKHGWQGTWNQLSGQAGAKEWGQGANKAGRDAAPG